MAVARLAAAAAAAIVHACRTQPAARESGAAQQETADSSQVAAPRTMKSDVRSRRVHGPGGTARARQRRVPQGHLDGREDAARADGDPRGKRDRRRGPRRPQPAPVFRDRQGQGEDRRRGDGRRRRRRQHRTVRQSTTTSGTPAAACCGCSRPTRRRNTSRAPSTRRRTTPNTEAGGGGRAGRSQSQRCLGKLRGRSPSRSEIVATSVSPSSR